MPKGKGNTRCDKAGFFLIVSSVFKRWNVSVFLLCLLPGKESLLVSNVVSFVPVATCKPTCSSVCSSHSWLESYWQGGQWPEALWVPTFDFSIIRESAERERDGATKREGSDSEDSLGCRSRRRRMLGSEAINLQCTANVWSPSGPLWENVDCTLHENSYGLQAGNAWKLL